MKVERSPAYLLHRRPFRETSSLLEVLTPEYGRVGLVYRGGRRSAGRREGVQPFSALRVSWSGRGELYTLTAIEMMKAYTVFAPTRILCGLYVNELIMGLVPRQSPGGVLYSSYERVMGSLGRVDDMEPELRRFEVALLGAVGYGLQLDCEGGTGAPLSPERWYRYDNEQGPVPCRAQGPQAISGRALLRLRSGAVDDPDSKAEIKRLLRRVLEHHLQGRKVRSREIFGYLNQ